MVKNKTKQCCGIGGNATASGADISYDNLFVSLLLHFQPANGLRKAVQNVPRIRSIPTMKLLAEPIPATAAMWDRNRV